MHKNNLIKPKTTLRQKITLIILSLFLSFLFLETGLRLGGLIVLAFQEYRNMASIRQRGGYRIMCLGESTTQRQYPPLLEEILNQHNIGIKFSVIDNGRAGINTSVILGHLELDLDKYHPDIVVAMMGINDDGSVISAGALSHSKIMLFLQSFRTYKLMRLPWLNLTATVKEKGFSWRKNNAPQFIPQAEHTKQTNIVSTENSFKKAIELNPENDQAYTGLGRFYQSQGNFSQAEDSFKKAIELNPKNERAYIELGVLYQDQGNFSQAEDSFKKAIELNPKKDQAYTGLGRLYHNQGNPSQAKDLFKKIIELNPKNGLAYINLGWFYRSQNDFSQAKELFKKAIEIYSEDDKLYAGLAAIYSETGMYELAQEYYKKANELRLEYHNPVTYHNYLRLKEAMDKRGIKLVCVQYPVRSADPLRKIFKGQAGVIFVDNERVFKEALKRKSYKEYFTDMFGGDFGHCTAKGNRLLAENIANVILKEVFKK